MPTRLDFDTPEGRLSLPLDDVQFMAYDASELAMSSIREFVERMRSMGLAELAETYARLIAQNKVTVMELREAREEAEALLASREEGEVIMETIMPRVEAMREVIAQTHIGLRASVDRMAALSAACHEALNQIPGYRPPARMQR